MELAKLRYFYTVARHGHVTRAAEEIHIAQPALTKAIKQLEEELGAPLFYKKGRNIYLTVFGEYLKTKLEGIFFQLDSIRTELEDLKQERCNTVKLNVLAASVSVTDAVVNYKKRHPEVIFQMKRDASETDCDISVADGISDLSCLSAFEKKTVMEEEIYIAIPNDSRYAQKERIALEELREEGFVYLAGSRAFHEVCERFFIRAGFKPRISFESDSLIAIRNVIGAHAGVGFWPAYSWGKSTGEVALLPISEPKCERELVIGLHRSPVPSPSAQEFYEYLVRYMTRLKQTADKKQKNRQ